MLEIKNVVKRYGNETALNHINLKFTEEIVGLMGVNGAGKTTLIKILTTLLKADEGDVLYCGESIGKNEKAYRDKIGYMPQYACYYPDFSVNDFLQYMCVLKDIPSKISRGRIDEVLSETNLIAVRNKKISALSGGMRQRLGIAQAILNDPKILILDEPTAGLDPIERIRFRQLIKTVATGKTVIIATHIAEDVETVAGRVIIMDKGCILTEVPINQNQHGQVEHLFMEILNYETAD